MATKVAPTVMALSLMLSYSGRAQEHGGFTNECDSLRNAASPDLVQFLNGVTPDEKNGDCVTWVIRKLGERKFESSVPSLVRLLDFRRPPTLREKQGIYLRMQGIWEIYPAVDALSSIGEKALPAILRALQADSTSPTARGNALFVWMEVYRQSDEHVKGVAVLKQEETKAKDDATKERLKWAVSKAITWCSPPEESACKRAAAFETP